MKQWKSIQVFVTNTKTQMIGFTWQLDRKQMFWKLTRRAAHAIHSWKLALASKTQTVLDASHAMLQTQIVYTLLRTGNSD